VNQFFVDTHQNPKWSSWQLVRYTTIIAIAFSTYYLQFFSQSIYLALSTRAIVALATIFGLSLAQVSAHIVHDGSHSSFTHNPFVWQFMAAFHDFVNGCSNHCWFHQHVIGHHIYTNIDGADPDIAVNAVDIRRIRPWQRWVKIYSQQWIYVPVLYCFLMTKTRVLDYDTLYRRRMTGNIRINTPTAAQNVVFWAGKVSAFFHVAQSSSNTET
jgi:fatty acid desaturase